MKFNLEILLFTWAPSKALEMVGREAYSVFI